MAVTRVLGGSDLPYVYGRFGRERGSPDDLPLADYDVVRSDDGYGLSLSPR